MKPTIDLYCGAPIEVESERIFFERLRADLTVRGVPALVFANFYPPKNAHQIDFLVVTTSCVCHVELKKLTAPVSGGINGRWSLRMPDGSLSALDAKNPYRQALDGKYAISDQMHAFASSDPSVPRPASGKKFYTGLESVVCIFPELPPGSTVYEDHRVRVVGYRDLLTIFETRQTNPGWTLDHWVAFAMHLGLVRVGDSADGVQAGTHAASAMADYGRRFKDFYSRGQPALVPTPIEENGVGFSADSLVDAFIAGEHLQLIGRPGCGKSLLAKHMALTAVRQGRLVIVAAAREYDGKLSTLLDRSVAHLHPDTALQILRAAEQLGRSVALVVDGFNECPKKWHDNLIRDLQAFSLRWPAPILITAHDPVPVPNQISNRMFRFASLDAKHKVAVLRAYAGDGLPTDAEALVEPFQTPYECSLAASCLEEAASLASRAALFDAYVQRCCETTTGAAVVRTVLCAVAARMQRRLASSLPMSEVRRLAAKVLSEERGTVRLLTEALGCGLLDVSQGRCSFRHELLERCLQAEAFIRQHSSGADLALELMMPRNRHLTEFVVAMETDRDAVRRCLEAVADPVVVSDCLRGQYGEIAKGVAAEDSLQVIDAAERALEHTVVQLTGDDEWKHLSITESPVWSSYDRALMKAVGNMLPHGLFLDEAFRLMAHTERRCKTLLAENESGALSRADAMHLFAGLFVFTSNDVSSCLPASTVYHASRFSGPRKANGAAAVRNALVRVAESLEQRSPGELLLFCEMLRYASPELQPIVPRLLRACWRTGIYHLRLDVLLMAQLNAARLEGQAREEVESFLSTLHSQHLGLSTAIVDVLLAYGMAQSPLSAGDVTAELAEILETGEELTAQKRAYHAVANIFEEVFQDAYWDAFSALERDDRVRLLTMAALGAPDYGFFTDWILRELLELEDVRALPAFRRWATAVDTKSTFPQDVTACYVLAMRGCARYLDEPPSSGQSQIGIEGAWHAYGAILFWLYKPGLSPHDRRAAASSWWERLHAEWPFEAVGALRELDGVHFKTDRKGGGTVDDLCAVFPDEVRSLLEFGLVKHTILTAHLRPMLFRDNVAGWLIRWLIVVGDRGTADLLVRFVDTPDVGVDAVKALRSLNEKRRSEGV